MNISFISRTEITVSRSSFSWNSWPKPSFKTTIPLNLVLVSIIFNHQITDLIVPIVPTLRQRYDSSAEISLKKSRASVGHVSTGQLVKSSRLCCPAKVAKRPTISTWKIWWTAARNEKWQVGTPTSEMLKNWDMLHHVPTPNSSFDP